MIIFAADDEPMMLDELVSVIREVKPKAEVHGFTNPKELLDYADSNPCDIAFLDVEMGVMSGIEVAKQLKLKNPQVNLIFATGYDKYMKNALSLRVSGYITKPVNREKVEEEFDNLRNPIEPDMKKENVLVAKCFGNFDVFVNGESLDFERRKTKELLAYLIDRRGSVVTSGEICSVLWEEAEDDKNTGHYLQVLKKDLITTLKKVNMEKVFKTGWNKYSVDTSLISCDYYDYIDNKAEGVRAFNGEYMMQYSWGEFNGISKEDNRR